MSLYDKLGIGFGSGFGREAGTLFCAKPTDPRGDLVVSRAGDTATEINKDGKIEEVLANVPQSNFPDGKCGKLLLEPAGTNLITYPISFDNAYWTKNGATIDDNGGAGYSSPHANYPTSAFKLVEDSANVGHRMLSFSSFTAGLYSQKIYAKAGERSVLQIFLGGQHSGTAYANFDLSNGTIPNSADLEANIKALANGWYECSVTFTAATTVSEAFYYSIADSDSMARAGTYLGDGASGLYVLGAQLEANSSSTSFIYDGTEGTTSLRNLTTINGGGYPSCINSNKGVFFVEMKALADTLTYRGIMIADGTATNECSIYFSSISNQVRAYYTNSGSTSVFEANLEDTTLNNKIAFSFENNFMKLEVNGVIYSVIKGQPTLTEGVFNTLAFENMGGTEKMEGEIKTLGIFTDTDINTNDLTSWNSFNELADNFEYTIL